MRFEPELESRAVSFWERPFHGIFSWGVGQCQRGVQMIHIEVLLVDTREKLC
jgi:hypothetical protein